MELVQSKGERTFGRILASAQYNPDSSASDNTLPTFGKPIKVSLNAAKSMRNFHTSDDCVNPKSFGETSYRKLIIVLQRIRRVFGRTAIESGISRFLTNRKKNFFWIYLIALTSRLVAGSTIVSYTG